MHRFGNWTITVYSAWSDYQLVYTYLETHVLKVFLPLQVKRQYFFPVLMEAHQHRTCFTAEASLSLLGLPSHGISMIPLLESLLISIANVTADIYNLVDGTNLAYGVTTNGEVFAWNMSNVIANNFLTAYNVGTSDYWQLAKRNHMDTLTARSPSWLHRTRGCSKLLWYISRSIYGCSKDHQPVFGFQRNNRCLTVEPHPELSSHAKRGNHFVWRERLYYLGPNCFNVQVLLYAYWRFAMDKSQLLKFSVGYNMDRLLV